MRSIVLSALLAMALPATQSWAHEGHDHGDEKKGQRVMGTVSAVDKDKNHIEVKDRDGKVVSISVTDKTKYVRGKAAAALADLKVGDRVVVNVTGDGETKTATEVRLSSATAEKTDKAAGEAAPKPHQH